MTLSAAAEAALRCAWNCRLTTRGRKTGQQRSVTIWYAYEDGVVYLTGASTEPHWCRNIRVCADVELSIGGVKLRGRAEVVDDEESAEAIRSRFTSRYMLARLSRMIGTGYTDSVAVRIAVEPA